MFRYLIRSLLQSDEPMLREMLYHALYVPPGQPSFPPEVVDEPEIIRYVERWGRAGDRGLAALDAVSVQPVGAVWSRLFSAEEKGYGYLASDIPELSIAVLPEYRNQGIGTSLLKQLISEAQNEFSALSLSVSADNPAVRLYLRLGFVIAAAQRTSLTMKLRLTR